MCIKYALVLTCLSGMAVKSYTQDDSTRNKTLNEVVISVNKWEQNINEVPNKITKLTRPFIFLNSPQTSADLLAQSGTVFIQKSQLGGGSPMIRGFATNRVLLVMDGVRMNNAIYRSGNLQNVITIDPLSLETAEVIFGPGSLVYGSDAIGGVMDFHSLKANLSTSEKTLVKGSLYGRYSSANQENTIHADINVAGKKWSFLASFTNTDFEDQKMGRNGGQDSYLRPEYVVRQGNADVIVANNNPRIQRFSGYNQLNFLQKTRFKPSACWDLQYSFIYAGTGHHPRYDRLIQYRNGALRYAEWSYGAMLWRMHTLHMSHTTKTKIYDEAKVTVSYQDYDESRVDRTRASNDRNKQQENVKALSVNLDALRTLGKGRLFYGIEYVKNDIGSTGLRTNIASGVITPMVSRYPDGSEWSTSGIYGSYKLDLNPKLTLTTGLRYSHNTVDAIFDTTFIKFPYQKAELSDGALTGNAGLVFRPSEGWQVNALMATGYRMPNVDDIGKLFESVPGNVTVPNPDLEPEYAWNFEAGAAKRIPGKLQAELTIFHTILNNAIVRRPFSFNGQDSIVFEGVKSRVEALQNVAKANVTGVQVSAEVFITKGLSVLTHANWINGKETDDVKNEQVPLRHAPPFYGSTFIKYRWNKLQTEFSAYYNGGISNENLAPSEQAKTEIYAKDDAGKPYSPGWYTLNLKTSYQFTRHFMLSVGWENFTNQRYRPYSSGIVAAGSNLIFALRASL